MLVVILVFLDHVADAKAVLLGLFVRQLPIIFQGQFKGVGDMVDQSGAHFRDRLNHAEEAALNILEVVAEQLVDVPVKVQIDGDHEPSRVHLEQKQVGQQRFASDDDLRVLDKFREGAVEQSLIL